MLLASSSFWTASWTSTRLTLAIALSLTWNDMPSTTCQRSFACRAKSWRASPPITSRHSTWCRCSSLCSWSTATTTNSSCRRSTASWRRSEWRQSSKSTKASWCRNRRSLRRTWTRRSPSRPTQRSWNLSSISSAIRYSAVSRPRWALTRASSKKQLAAHFSLRCFNRSAASVATTMKSTSICWLVSSSRRGSLTSCRGGRLRRNRCRATTRWPWTTTERQRCRRHQSGSTTPSVMNSHAPGSRCRRRCSSWQCACVRGWMPVSSKCRRIEHRRWLPSDRTAPTTWSWSSRSLKRSRRTRMKRSLTMVSFRCSTTNSPT